YGIGKGVESVKIWKLDFELDKYDNLTLVNKLSIEEVQSFDGSSKKVYWVNPEVVRLEPEKKLPLSDAPGLYAHLPVFNDKAITVLNKYLEKTAEILPLKNSEDNFYAINILKVLDCIDYDKSEFKLFKDGKRIMRFKKYSFLEDKIQDCHIFKIKDEPLGSPFVTDDFRDVVKSNELTGFIFKQVWDSEE
ncbi:MAG: DUF1629 domain-containing protein, partial [Bacillota bacterium]